MSAHSARPRLLGCASTPDRALYLAHLLHIDDWPDDLDEPEPHFAVLLAMDATSTYDAKIASLASRLISQGMVDLYAWGPDCKRVHDICDRVDMDRGVSTDDAFVSTAWYDDEDLDEAVWDAVSLLPSEAYIETCRAVVAIVVDHADWSERVETAFTDFEAFNKAVLLGNSRDDRSGPRRLLDRLIERG